MKMGNPKLPTKLLSACNQEREIGPSNKGEENLIPQTPQI